MDGYVLVANSHSSADGALKQPTAVLPPSVVIKRSTGGGDDTPARCAGVVPLSEW
jgi:hypothetical protein